jgi:peptide/nickel transport system substrate-binding protein
LHYFIHRKGKTFVVHILRRKNMKKILALLLALAMIFSLAACTSSNEPAPAEPSGGEEPSGEPHYKEEIVIGMADEFTTIDPMETTAETNQIVQDCTHDLLTDTNLDTMQNEGELVDHWEMIDPTHWRFVLKEGVKFHDGTILDTEDVRWTLMERAPQFSTTSAYAAKIKEFTIVDDLTFDIELVNGDVDFNYTFAANSLAILSKEAFESMPPEEAVKIGTGPWMFEEFVSGDYVSLVRFEDCTLYPVPNTKRLVFKMIPEASDRMIALENGEVDVIMSPSATDYNRLIEDENLQLITETGRTQNFVGFNLQNDKSIVSNQKFRLAVAKAINKEDMVIAAWDGYAQVSTNIHCRDMGYYHDIEGIPYDPDGAKALFEELGVDGMTIPLVTSDAAHRQKMATELQSQLSKYGITITIETMQNSALTELNTSDGHTNGVELYIASWTPGKNADYMYRNPMYSTGGRNYSHLQDPEIDALIDAAAGEEDTAKRSDLYLELQTKLTCEIIPWVPIAQPTLTFGAAAGITGAKIHPGLVHQFKEVEMLVND